MRDRIDIHRRDWDTHLPTVVAYGAWLLRTRRILHASELQDYYEHPADWDTEYPLFRSDVEDTRHMSPLGELVFLGMRERNRADALGAA